MWTPLALRWTESDLWPTCMASPACANDANSTPSGAEIHEHGYKSTVSHTLLMLPRRSALALPVLPSSLLPPPSESHSPSAPASSDSVQEDQVASASSAFFDGDEEALEHFLDAFA
eukprot:755949-Hanusia_phi.AAC.5